MRRPSEARQYERCSGHRRHHHALPRLFRLPEQGPEDAGHRVYVISYRANREVTSKELKKFGIVFDESLLAEE